MTFTQTSQILDLLRLIPVCPHCNRFLEFFVIANKRHSQAVNILRHKYTAHHLFILKTSQRTFLLFYYKYLILSVCICKSMILLYILNTLKYSLVCPSLRVFENVSVDPTAGGFPFTEGSKWNPIKKVRTVN